MQEDAAKFVGSIPEYYDRNLGPRIFEGFAENLARRISAQNPDAVLELAAGTGIVSRIVRDALPEQREIVVTDLNEPMLEAARRKFRRNERVTIQQADALSLPFENESFDSVLCQFGVMFFPDKLKSYQEVLRVLRTDGNYTFNVWDTWQNNSFAQLAHETVAGFFPEDPPGFYKVPFGYADTDEIETTLKDAGFSAISHETVTLQSEIPSFDHFAKGLVYGNPLFDEILARNGDPEGVRTRIASALREKLGSPMTLQAIVISAQKR